MTRAASSWGGQSQVRLVPSLEAVSVLFYYLNRGVAIALTKRPELAGCLDNLELVVISWFLFFTPLLHDTAVGRSARERARIRRPLRPRPRGRLPGTKGKHCALRALTQTRPTSQPPGCHACFSLPAVLCRGKGPVTTNGTLSSVNSP